MARYASFCFTMDPFNHFSACMPDISGTQENTARLSAGIIRHIWTTWRAVYCRAWCTQLVWLSLGYI